MAEFDSSRFYSALGTADSIAEKNKEEIKKRYSDFFLNEPSAMQEPFIEQEKREVSRGLNSIVAGTTSQFTNENNLYLTPDDATGLKNAPVDKALSAFKEDTQSILNTPEYDKYTKAQLLQLSFDYNIKNAKPGAIRGFIQAINDKSLASASTENKLLKDFISDNLEAYQEYVEDISLSRMGSKIEGLTKGADSVTELFTKTLKEGEEDVSGDYAALSLLPFTFGHELYQVGQELFPGLEFSVWDIIFPGDMRAQIKARIKELPLEVQKEYITKMSDIISRNEYAGMENDYIKWDLAQSLLEEEDSTSTDIALDNIWGVLDTMSVIPIVGAASNNTRQGGRQILKQLRKWITGDGRSVAERIEDLARGRIPENSAFSIASSIDPNAAEEVLLEALKDSTGRLASAIGTTKEGLTVETILPKMQGSKVTPNVGLDFSYYTSTYTDREKIGAAKSTIESMENILDEVRSVTETGTVLPTNVFVGYDNGNISVEYHVTANSTMGFNTYEHARAVADSYLNRLTRSDIDGVSVEIYARDVGANEYKPVTELSTQDGVSTVGDYRVVLKSEGTPSGKHALDERLHKEGKVAGWMTQFFDKSNWMNPWGNIATAQADDRASGFVKQLRETIKPLNSLKVRDQREVFALIDEGDARQHWFTPQELMERFHGHPRQNDLIQAYYSFQRHQELQKSLIDFGAKKLLDSNNAREFFFANTRVLPKNTGLDTDLVNKSARYDKDGNLVSSGLPQPAQSGSTILAAPVEAVPPDITRVYDAEFDRLRNITDADKAALKDKRVKAYKMMTKQYFGQSEYQYILALPESKKFVSKETPHRVTRDSPGYLTRAYDAAYLAILELPVFTDRGGEGLRKIVLGIEQNKRDAQVLLEEVKQAWKAKRLAEVSEQLKNKELDVTKRVSKYQEKKLKAAEKEQKLLAQKYKRATSAHQKKINEAKSEAIRQIYKEWRNESINKGRVIADPLDVLKGQPSTFATHRSADEAAKEFAPEMMKGELPEHLKQKLADTLAEIDKRMSVNAPVQKAPTIDVASAVEKRKQGLLDTVNKKYQKELDDIEETVKKRFRVGYADEIDISTGKKAFDPNSFEWLEASGQLYTSARRPEELRGRGGRRVVKSISDTMEQARRTASRMATLELTIDKLVRNYDQLYGSAFGKFPWLGDLAAPDNLDPALKPFFRSAESHVNYVKMLAGLDRDLLAEWQRSLMIWAAEGILSPRFDSWQSKLSDQWSSRVENARRSISNSIMRNRNGNIISKAKSVAFFQLITARPFRQALLQTSQMSMYLGREDYGRYFFSGEGMKEYAGIWTGLAARSVGQFDTVKQSLAKNMGMSLKEYESVIEAYERSGLPASIDSHVWTFDSNLARSLDRLADETENASAFKDGVHTARNKFNFTHKWMRRMGFDLGEQSQLLMAFLAEKHAWQKAHGDTSGILWKQGENLTEIAGRARILSGNMNQAGKLGLQNSIPGLVFQFLSHTSKMAMMMVPSHIGKWKVPFADKIVSDAITNAERGRILWTQALLYGTGGTGLTMGWEALRDEVITEELNLEVDRKLNMIVEEGLFGSLVNGIANFIDQGQDLVDLEVSRSVSPLGGAIGLNVNNPLTKVLDLLFVSNGTMEDWAGPGYQVLKRMVGDEFLGTFWDIVTGANYLTTPERIGTSLVALGNSLLLESDTWVRSRYEHAIDNYISQYGNLGARASDIEILSKTLFAIRSRESREYSDLKMDIKGLQNDPKISPEESFVKATSLANEDFKTLKDALIILNDDLSVADLRRMVRSKQELRKLTMLPGEYIKYRTQMNKHLVTWTSDTKQDNRSGKLKGGSEFEFINLLTQKHAAMSADPLEDMISKMRNMEDFPQKEQLISRMERIIK